MTLPDTMNFVKTISNEENRKQALFEHDGDYYFYSYVNNEYAHETMVFHADADGNITNYMDLAFGPDYVSSGDMMKRVLRNLGKQKSGVANNEVNHNYSEESS